ncbi:MAG: Wadjet anti-phage system protein JetD domain-containing protein, partial [Betaproteobacteria bacterium]
WDRLLAVVVWLQAHPRPAVYLRQVNVPGVDSKFIEAHRGVLAELLDLALPPEVIELDATGVAQFTRRFGFLDKPVRIRFRLLDPSLPSLPGCEGLPDITLDAASFAALTLPARRVFITENETNFLAFPPAAGAIVVFGAGYGWEPLARASWLHRCQLHYWGDIDTHGFAILDQLRGYFPGVASFLMDRATLLAHRLHWGEEPDPARHDLSRLTPEETAVYDDLRFDRHQPRLRLEQERVGFGWLCDRLACIPSGALVAPPPRS